MCERNRSALSLSRARWRAEAHPIWSGQQASPIRHRQTPMDMTMPSDQEPRVPPGQPCRSDHLGPASSAMVDRGEGPPRRGSHAARYVSVVCGPQGRGSPNQLFSWKRRMLEGGLEAVRADDDVVGSSRLREAPLLQRQPRLSAVEGLDLGLLVDRQHDGMRPWPEHFHLCQRCGSNSRVSIFGTPLRCRESGAGRCRISRSFFSNSIYASGFRDRGNRIAWPRSRAPSSHR